MELLNTYDINNPYYLYEDIEMIFNEIDELYIVEFPSNSEFKYFPKTKVSTDHSWAGLECKDAFNKLVPKIKSLTKDMYSIIEGVFKTRKGSFKKLELEKKYKNLKHFRVFNNKLKHHNDREATFNLTQILYLDSKGHIIDVSIQYKYKDEEKIGTIPFTSLISVFIEILEKERVISINRK